MGIFGGYDVRGIYGEELAEREAAELGKAFGTWLGGGSVAVGRDNRSHSPSLEKAFVEGLVSTGRDVVLLGEVPTPLVYHALALKWADAGVVVTASHNPPEYNGFKFCKGLLPLSSSELAELKAIFECKRFLEAEEAGCVTEKGVVEAYLRYVHEKVKAWARLKVVVDCGNGVCGPVAVKMLEGLGCRVVPLYCEPDSSFPNHLADPHKEETLADLKRKVVEEHADLGVAFDGDGDRVAFVDELGRKVGGDGALVLFIRDELSRRKAPVVFEVRCSKAVEEEILAAGGRPVMVAAGRVAVREKMGELKALFGGEITGHTCFGENYCFDDAFFAAAKMVSLLSRSSKRLSELADSVPKYFSTDELRLPCADEEKFELVEEVKASLSQNHQVNGLDGVRVDLPDAWGLLRVSNTQPQVTLRFEGKTRKALEEVYALFAAELARQGLALPRLG